MTRATRRIEDLVRAFEACGHPVRGLRLYVDGTIDLLTEVASYPNPSDDDGDWVTLAGSQEISRAHRA